MQEKELLVCNLRSKTKLNDLSEVAQAIGSEKVTVEEGPAEAKKGVLPLTNINLQKAKLKLGEGI